MSALLIAPSALRSHLRLWPAHAHGDEIGEGETQGCFGRVPELGGGRAGYSFCVRGITLAGVCRWHVDLVPCYCHRRAYSRSPGADSSRCARFRLIVINLTGKIQYINKMGLEISGYSKDELLNSDLGTFLNNESINTFEIGLKKGLTMLERNFILNLPFVIKTVILLMLI